jgi:hypothetical protein
LERRAAVRRTYQVAQSRSKQKFEVNANRELRVKVELSRGAPEGRMPETESGNRVLAKKPYPVDH